MAIRNDFSIDWLASPRIITIAAPSVSCAMQDLLDTLRSMESHWSAMDDAPIVDASGKEELDDTTKVGITVKLLNARVAFEARDGTEYGGVDEWTLCTLNGGNVVAQDITGNKIDARYPTSFTTVDRTSSASATLQEQDALQYSSYGEVVSVLNGSPTSGTAYPSGNKEYPVNNIPDAVIIAWSKGLDTLEMRGDHTFGLGDNPAKLKIRGQNKILTSLTFEDGADMLDCQISNAKITGVLDGGSIINKCNINGLNYVNGEINNSTLEVPPIYLGGTEEALFDMCKSGVAGANTPEIVIGAGRSLIGRGYIGGMRFSSRTGTDPVSWDFISGHAIISASCTGDPIILRGSFKLTVEVGATYPNISGRTAMGADLDDLPARVLDEVAP